MSIPVQPPARDGSSSPEALVQRSVGARIRELRKARGLSGYALARAAGISQSHLSKIETGKATLSVAVLARICQVLDRPLSYLFQSDEQVPRVLGTLTTVAGPESEGLRWFADEVRRRTRGRMSLIPLRASQLGPAEDQVEHLRQGALDLFVEEIHRFARLTPHARVFGVPYAFRSEAHRQAVLASPWFRHTVHEALLSQGVRLINPRWNWMRGVEYVLLARRPLFAPRDVEGLRVRVSEPAGLARLWEELGAEPVVVPWAEVKRALRDGRIDVLPTHKSHLYPMGLCRYARYVTRLGDGPSSLAIAVNDAKYQALPPAIQEAIRRACEAAGERFTRIVTEAERRNEPLNIARYHAAYLTVDTGPWRRAFARGVRRMLGAGDLPGEAWETVERLAREAGGERSVGH